MIDDVAKHYGCEVVRTAVGEANVVEAMKSLKASGRDVVLGGEGNGGVIWPQVTYVRDSLSGMALTLSLMARTGKSVSQLVQMVNSFGPTNEVKAHGYTIIKQKSALASKADAVPVVAHLDTIYAAKPDCRVDLQDGIRIDWDARGVWAHVRASNTEPIMRVIVEAPSSDEAQAVAAEIDAQIAALGG
jgi:phosphomannomutase